MKYVYFFTLVIWATTCFANSLDVGLETYKEGDYATAIKIFRPLAEKGDAKAQNYMGHMFNRGEGTAQDPTQAIKWFRKSADQGNAIAQLNMGHMYFNPGLHHDYKQALTWYLKASDYSEHKTEFPNTVLAAELKISEMYHKGLGVPQDLSEAAAWVRKSADRGNAQSQYELALLYLKGEGVPYDIGESKAWLHKAAAQGYDQARSLLWQSEFNSFTDELYGLNERKRLNLLPSW